MKIILLLAACLYLADGYAVKHCANLVKFGNKNYEKHYIIQGTVSKPFHLTFDKTNNKILYHEDSEPFGNSETHIYDITTKKDQVVEGATDAFSSITDNTGNFLIATTTGIYKYNPTDNKYTPYALQGTNIDGIFWHDNVLYYVGGPESTLYTYKDGKSTKVLDVTMDMNVVISQTGDIVFTDGNRLHIKHQGTDKAVTVPDTEKLPIESLVERNGTIYLVSTYGVYSVNLKTLKVTRVSMKGMLDLVFDGEDIIYSDEEHIVKLTPTTKVCE